MLTFASGMEAAYTGRPIFRIVPRDALAVTEDIGRRPLGLPMAPDLSDEAIERVVAGLHRAVLEQTT